MAAAKRLRERGELEDTIFWRVSVGTIFELPEKKRAQMVVDWVYRGMRF